MFDQPVLATSNLVKVVAEKDGAVTGNALSFNGIDQTVKINTNNKTIAYNTAGLSVSVWLKSKQSPSDFPNIFFPTGLSAETQYIWTGPF